MGSGFETGRVFMKFKAVWPLGGYRFLLILSLVLLVCYRWSEAAIIPLIPHLREWGWLEQKGKEWEEKEGQCHREREYIEGGVKERDGPPLCYLAPPAVCWLEACWDTGSHGCHQVALGEQSTSSNERDIKKSRGYKEREKKMQTNREGWMWKMNKLRNSEKNIKIKGEEAEGMTDSDPEPQPSI